ncbi:MAG: insulinase family protein [Alphaproteobacteria bacterium]|nr:insulinase family protein [Alphaproteobacteria bacterium]
MSELFTLKNGMRCYVDPMPELDTAAIGVWARAGTIDETPEESGVAHLLEHMAFKGTGRRTARQIAEEVESVGGYLNAATGYQRTGYYARVLKDDVERAIDILADILTDPLFEEVELEKEKEVVVQEIGEAWDQPDDAVHELLQARIFAGQSLGRPILGSVESVRSHDPSRLRAFMRRLYQPERMVIAAAGAVDAEKIARWAEIRFPPRTSSAPAARTPPRYVGGVAADPRDIEQTHLAIAFPAVGARHEDYFATRILAEALGGGMASRLFQTVREERGLAYSVYAYADCYDDAGALGIYLGTDVENALEGARLSRSALEKSREDLSQREVDRARAMLTSTMLMGLESPTGRIETAAGQLFTFGEVLTPAAIRAKLDAVSVEDARRCADRALTDGAVSFSLVGPGDFAALAEAIGARLSDG